MSDVKSLSAKRTLELKGRKAKLEELKAKGDKAAVAAATAELQRLRSLREVQP